MVGKVEEKILALLADRGRVPVAPAKPRQQRRYDRMDQKGLIKITGGDAYLTDMGRKAHERAEQRRKLQRRFTIFVGD